MELSHIDVLADLSPEERSRLGAVCAERNLAPGEVVFREGEAGDDLYLVIEGRVQVTKAMAPDVDRPLAVLGPGGVFGELAMVGEGARSATATAVGAARVWTLTREGFASLTRDEPRLGLKVLGRFAAMLAERLRLTTDLLRDTVQWGLEVSGAASIGLHRLIRSRVELTLSLADGQRLRGRLLKVETGLAGSSLLIDDTDGVLTLVPYHAIVSLAFAREELPLEEVV